MKFLASSRFRLLALVMAATVYLGAPLMVAGGEPWVTPLLTALVVCAAVAAMSFAVSALRATGTRRVVVVLITAALVGAVTSVIVFPWNTHGLLGLAICVPLAIVAAGVGLIMEWVMTKMPALALLATIVGGALLLSSVVGLIIRVL